MTKKQFKQQLKEQAYAAVPDKHNDLLKTIAEKNSRVVHVSDNEGEPHLALVVPAKKTADRWLALAACFAVVVIAVTIAVTSNKNELTRKGVDIPHDVTTSRLKMTATQPGYISVPSQDVTDDTVTTHVTKKGETTVTHVTKKGETTSTCVTKKSETSSVGATGTTQHSGMWIHTTTTANRSQHFATTADVSRRVTEQTYAPVKKTTAKPTVKSTVKTTAKPTKKPVSKPTCSHEILYRPPVTETINKRPDSVNTCVKYYESTPADVPPTQAPSYTQSSKPSPGLEDFGVKFGGSTPGSGGIYYVYYLSAQSKEKQYIIHTDVCFADRWMTQFDSICEGKTILYTEVSKYTDTGVCVYEEKYNEKTGILTAKTWDTGGNLLNIFTRSVLLSSWEFTEINIT